MLRRIFYGPPDWLAYRIAARTRRAVQFWVGAFWFPPMPGFWLWTFERDAVWLVGLMSLVALWMTGGSGTSAETPVEREDED